MEINDHSGNQAATAAVPAKRDRIWDFVMVQTVTAAAALLFVIAARAAGGEFYDTVKEWYNDNFRETTSVDEVIYPDDGERNDTESDGAGDGTVRDGLLAAAPASIKIQKTTDPVETNLTANAMALPVSGVVTSGFGYRIHPINGGFLMHSGIDIAADEGTPVAAAWDGVVTECGTGTSYGKYIVIKHTDGLCTLYAHCRAITAREGQAVSKGENVALVGSTGVSTGPHLHFEIRLNGEAIDPRSILKIE